MARLSVSAAILAAVLLAAGEPRAALAEGQDSGAAPTNAAAADAPDDGNALSSPEAAAIGCGVAAGGGLLATYLTAPTEIALTWGGGIIVPSGSLMLGLVLLGQIGSTSCAFGVLVTPTVLWAYNQSGNIAAKLAQVPAGIAGQLGHLLAGANGNSSESQATGPAGDHTGVDHSSVDRWGSELSVAERPGLRYDE